MAELNSESLEDFVGQFTYLSGDMELPLEDKLPGPFDFMSYRISANEHCGLMFYYFHDEVIFIFKFFSQKIVLIHNLLSKLKQGITVISQLVQLIFQKLNFILIRHEKGLHIV